jgi:hypothetical protein
LFTKTSTRESDSIRNIYWFLAGPPINFNIQG